MHSSPPRWVLFALIALMAVYSVAVVLPWFFGKLAVQLIVAAQIIPPALFALIHGSQVYRLRGILAFTLICLAIGNIFENLGIRTGFPFGSYYFASVMGA